MREYLFRGKTDDGDKRWCFGNLTQIKNNAYISECGFLGTIGVIPETVGQFTGLTDKNGIKIFEGDIVQLFDKYHNCTAEGYGKIIFSYEYVGGWVITSNGEDRLSLGIHTDIVEVIGNIHDNPELFEVKTT